MLLCLPDTFDPKGCNYAEDVKEIFPTFIPIANAIQSVGSANVFWNKSPSRTVFGKQNNTQQPIARPQIVKPRHKFG